MGPLAVRTVPPGTILGPNVVSAVLRQARQSCPDVQKASLGCKLAHVHAESCQHADVPCLSAGHDKQNHTHNPQGLSLLYMRHLRVHGNLPGVHRHPFKQGAPCGPHGALPRPPCTQWPTSTCLHMIRLPTGTCWA
jgi:hypothetical protein